MLSAGTTANAATEKSKVAAGIKKRFIKCDDVSLLISICKYKQK